MLWFVSYNLPRREKRSHLRATETFPNEREAKNFARAKLAEARNVNAGTINPHLPKRTVASARMLEWLEERHKDDLAWVSPHLGMLQAINRHRVREFNTSRKTTHWGKRKLKRDGWPAIAIKPGHEMRGANGVVFQAGSSPNRNRAFDQWSWEGREAHGSVSRVDQKGVYAPGRLF
jgi:hypothetical protein